LDGDEQFWNQGSQIGEPIGRGVKNDDRY